MASSMDAVTLDPWHEPGIPLDEQYRSWKQRIKAPYDKQEVDAYTRTRVILMNGVENGAWNFSHHFSRSTDDRELRSLLARTRMVEQQQQTTINWLNPADQTVLETTIAYEQVAIDLTAYFARVEPQEDEHLGWAQEKLASLSLSDGAKPPSAQETPASRTSPV